MVEVLVDAAEAKRGINQVLLKEAEGEAVMIAAHLTESRDGCSF